MPVFLRTIVFLGVILPSIASCNEPDTKVELETTVCGLKEPFLFWLWSSMAGSPDKSNLRGLQGVDDISFVTTDNRTLRGYRLRSHLVKPAGYLLVLQGNAILADQLIGEFNRYAQAGYDVYMYDYRGYGRSQGKRRLRAMVSDIREILASLRSKGYARQVVYAFSFGGILLLDGFDSGLALDRIVIDSSPARLSDHGCPQDYDPVSHLPSDCSNFMIIAGQRDNVVTPRMSQTLREQATQRGARVILDKVFAHPFMDPDIGAHQRRMQLVADFLLADSP